MNPSDDALLLFDTSAHAFRPIDDRVMGGESSSSLTRSTRGYGVFRGELSLENNGGFASVRSTGLGLDVSGATRLVLRARGDGKRYKLRLYDGRDNGVAFQAVFDTKAGEWQEVTILLDEFEPVWRGRAVRDAPPLDREQVDVGLMISDEQEGRFSLEVDWLAAR